MRKSDKIGKAPFENTEDILQKAVKQESAQTES